MAAVKCIGRGREDGVSKTLNLQFIEFLRTESFVIFASRAAGPASHGRGYASAADPEAGSAENRLTS